MMIEFRSIEPAVFDELEAATYLRLVDDDQDDKAARRRINRLVDRGLLRPCLIGGKRRYWRRELDRFLEQQTDTYAAEK